MIIFLQLILQKQIPYDTTYPNLPGTRPISPDEWIICDDAFSQQMALRDKLIETKKDKVLAISDEAQEAAVELLKMTLDFCVSKLGYKKNVNKIIRPDKVSVEIDLNEPMTFLGRLVQNDFCILQKKDNEHVLTAAALCFPASWSLEEKFLKPLIDIHIPVKEYDDVIAKRVQRLFDGLKINRPVWRFNALYYEDPNNLRVEFQVDNFETKEEANAYIHGEAFAKNPIGVAFDPEKLMARFENGDSIEELAQLGSAP